MQKNWIDLTKIMEISKYHLHTIILRYRNTIYHWATFSPQIRINNADIKLIFVKLSNVNCFLLFSIDQL